MNYCKVRSGSLEGECTILRQVYSCSISQPPFFAISSLLGVLQYGIHLFLGV